MFLTCFDLVLLLPAPQLLRMCRGRRSWDQVLSFDLDLDVDCLVHGGSHQVSSCFGIAFQLSFSLELEDMAVQVQPPPLGTFRTSGFPLSPDGVGVCPPSMPSVLPLTCWLNSESKSGKRGGLRTQGGQPENAAMGRNQ